MTDTITSYDPSTGDAVGTVEIATASDVAVAAAAARKAFEDWGGLDQRTRNGHLRRLLRVVIDQADHIAATVAAETGKTVGDALLSEVATSAGILDYLIRRGPRILRKERRSTLPFPVVKGWVEYHPRGVAGIISPWNYPFGLPFNSAVTALAAGCTALVKPSEVTPLSGQLVAGLAGQAGIPDGVVQVVHGAGATGTAVIRHSDIVSFTGSPVTARKVALEAANTLTPVIYELGGKDAMIVLEDADVRRAARAAVWGGLFNTGQTCISVERVYVVDKVYDEFLAHVAEEFEQMNVASGDAADIGPITHPPQLEVVERHIADAIGKGATVRSGGRRHDSDLDYYEPTLLTEVDHTMDVMVEETFGPVLPLMRVPTEEAALELANDSSFGLHGSVWTRNKARGRRIASAMQTGTVAINDALINYGIPDLPFGGVDQSGHGSRNGPEGLRAFTYPKSITQRRFPLPRELWWFPRRDERLWKAFVRLAARR